MKDEKKTQEIADELADIAFRIPNIGHALMDYFEATNTEWPAALLLSSDALTMYEDKLNRLVKQVRDLGLENHEQL